MFCVGEWPYSQEIHIEIFGGEVSECQQPPVKHFIEKNSFIKIYLYIYIYNIIKSKETKMWNNINSEQNAFMIIT